MPKPNSILVSFEVESRLSDDSSSGVYTVRLYIGKRPTGFVIYEGSGSRGREAAYRMARNSNDKLKEVGKA